MKAWADAVFVKHPVVDAPIVIPVENAIGVGKAAANVVEPAGTA